MAAGGFAPVMSLLGVDGQAVQLAVVPVSQVPASNEQSKDAVTAADSFPLHVPVLASVQHLVQRSTAMVLHHLAQGNQQC